MNNNQRTITRSTIRLLICISTISVPEAIKKIYIVDSFILYCVFFQKQGSATIRFQRSQATEVNKGTSSGQVDNMK